MENHWECELKKQGIPPGKCRVKGKNKTKTGPACQVTLKYKDGIPYRLISSAHLSRPEHYFSIYQSGCNMDCRKCHSWHFSQHEDPEGEWMSPDDILVKAQEYARSVTYEEPRERATSFHALDLCRGCGACVQLGVYRTSDTARNGGELFLRPTGQKGELCPDKLEPHQIMLSPQGYGPARNIVAFTGGDLGCKPGFYASCAEKIKAKPLSLHVLFETNGYGLTLQNLDMLQAAGIDAFWLDIKAFEPEVHRKLTGVDNEGILRLPEEMIKRNFVLEVLSLFIPGWVETDQLKEIANVLFAVDKEIPFTILAFFPEYKMKNVPSPNLEQMLSAYEAVREVGLQHVRLGNIGVFVQTGRELETLVSRTGGAI